MKIPYRMRPGAGFVALLVVTVVVVAFLFWGFREPDLDRVWYVLEKARQGKTLDEGEVAFLDRQIDRHPEIAFDILDQAGADVLGPDVDGFVTDPLFHVVLAPIGKEGREVLVECRCATLYPLTVAVDASSLRVKLEFEEDGAQSFRVEPGMATAGPKKPFLAAVTADGDFEADPAVGGPCGVRLSMDPGLGGGDE